MRRNSGYGTYRGKSKFRTFLKIVIAVLLIVLALLVAAFFFLQQYMVISADGIRFEIPFFQEQPSPTVSDPVLVTPSTPVIVTPSPEPEPEPVYARMITLPDDLIAEGRVKGLVFDVTDEEILAQYPGVKEADRLIFCMKGWDGQLRYVSGVPLAKEVRASSGDTSRNEGIAETNDGNAGVLFNIAYLSCFRDNTAPYNQNNLALRTSIGNWRGPGDVRWMSPQVEAARQYVADLCAELAGMGFRELLLDNAAFPPEGNLNLLVEGDRYDPAAFESTVTGFYRQVREALEAYYGPRFGGEPFKLGIVTDKTTLDDGVNPLTGQSLDALCQYADRIYVDLEGADPAGYYEKLEAAGMENPGEDLVVILDAPPAGDVAYSWAVLPEQ